MKLAAALVVIIHCLTISDSRLIKKITEAKLVYVTSTSAIPVRHRRFLAFDDSVASDSRDEHSNESAFHGNPTDNYMNNSSQSSKKRITRNSNGTIVDSSKLQPVNEIVLVKKPIPKFSDLDDYEYEAWENRILPRYVETDELEDEDFNVDDYDFDVKHDEFAGRGKPSVPRLKDRDKTPIEPMPEPRVAGAPVPAKDRQIVQNTSKLPVTSKQKNTNKGVEKSKDEFYDFEITTKNAEKDKAEEVSNETDESKEFERTATRRARSPWHEIMLPVVKNYSLPPKRIAVLPMFPVGSASRTSDPE